MILLKCYLVHKRKRLKQVCLKQSSHQVAKVIPVEIKTALSSNALRKTPVSGIRVNRDHCKGKRESTKSEISI